MKLSHVLAAKILITAVFWCEPLLLSPAWLYALLGIPLPQPTLFRRLLFAAAGITVGLLVASSDGVGRGKEAGSR